jgi:hypothetical protein
MLVGIGGVALTSAVRGGASQFDPKTVTGLVAWYKSDAGVLDASGNVITVDNTKIKTWQDQSGNGKHLVQATVGNQPAWRNAANGINGVPAVYFTGASTNYLVSSAFDLSSFTIFMVHKISVESVIYEQGNAATGNGQFAYTSQNASFYVKKAAAVNGKDSAISWGSGNVLMQWNVRYAGTSVTHTMRKNGVDQTLTVRNAGDPGTATTNGALTLGARASATAPVTGFIAEALFYNAALAAGDITNIEAYLKKKWGTP